MHFEAIPLDDEERRLHGGVIIRITARIVVVIIQRDEQRDGISILDYLESNPQPYHFVRSLLYNHYWIRRWHSECVHIYSEAVAREFLWSLFSLFVPLRSVLLGIQCHHSADE